MNNEHYDTSDTEQNIVEDGCLLGQTNLVVGRQKTAKTNNAVFHTSSIVICGGYDEPYTHRLTSTLCNTHLSNWSDSRYDSCLVVGENRIGVKNGIR
ncbi:MAG: hypothetical protein U9R01_00605 [candidate division WOR-3 bacterium]|nr:hypothetical protein [candidate division WOR-3 bacterium]